MKDTKMVILNGLPTSGKDTFVELCQKHTPYIICHISTITPIKGIAQILGWNGEKNFKYRKFLSDLKDLCTETFDTSFNYIKTEYEIAKEENIDFLFVDCREPKEIERLKQYFNAVTVCIDARERLNELKTSNHADTNVYNYHYDYYIENNSTIEDLTKSAELFVNILKGEI